MFKRIVSALTALILGKPWVCALMGFVGVLATPFIVSVWCVDTVCEITARAVVFWSAVLMSTETGRYFRRLLQIVKRKDADVSNAMKVAFCLGIGGTMIGWASFIIMFTWSHGLAHIIVVLGNLVVTTGIVAYFRHCAALTSSEGQQAILFRAGVLLVMLASILTGQLVHFVAEHTVWVVSSALTAVAMEWLIMGIEVLRREAPPSPPPPVDEAQKNTLEPTPRLLASASRSVVTRRSVPPIVVFVLDFLAAQHLAGQQCLLPNVTEPEYQI